MIYTLSFRLSWVDPEKGVWKGSRQVEDEIRSWGRDW